MANAAFCAMVPVMPLSAWVKVTSFFPTAAMVVVVISVGAGVAVDTWAGVGGVAAGWVHPLTSSTSTSMIPSPMIPGRYRPE